MEKKPTWIHFNSLAQVQNNAKAGIFRFPLNLSVLIPMIWCKSAAMASAQWWISSGIRWNITYVGTLSSSSLTGWKPPIHVCITIVP